jgi:hypothetical protein
MANRIPGWGGEPAKKSNIRPNKSKKTGPKMGIKKLTANNRFRSLAVRRNATLRNKMNKVRGLTRSNKMNKVRGLTRSNKSANLRAFAAANNENGNKNGNENENENNNENENENGLGLNLGGGAGGGLFEPQPIVRPKAVRAYPPPVAPAPARKERGMGFNMANLAGALPHLNLGPAAAGAGGAPVRSSLRNNNNELRRRKTRTN